MRHLNPSIHRPFLVAVVLGVSMLCLGPSAGRAESFRPDDDNQVLLRLPRLTAEDGSEHPLAELRRRRAQLQRQPDDLAAALDFAGLALQLGRQEGDPRFYGYIEGALEPWWQLPMPPVEVLFVRATLAQHRHHFLEALSDLEQVLRQRPRWTQAWMSRAVILSVQGNLEAARQSCRPLARLASPLLATSCSSHVEGLGPRLDEAYEGLRSVVEGSPGAAADQRLWATVTLAELAHRRGDGAAARRHFLDARALDGQDLYLLIAYADFLLDQGRPAEVEELLRQRTRQTSLLLRLALAEQALGRSTVQDRITTLEGRYVAGQARRERLHLGEEARFALDLLHQPQRALELAEVNWMLQREPIDSRILLRAAVANGTPERALPVIEQVQRQGLRDRRILALVDTLEGTQ